MQVIGHRGAAALAPENTWIGFDKALALGVDAIETDVQATSDGVLVLIHDLRLDRTTDGQGLVAETPWPVVRGLDAGSWFDPQYRDARVPLLDEALARYGRRTHIALEIKQPGIEIEVLDRVKALGLLDAVTFTSFDFASVERIRREELAAHVGFLTSDISAASVAACPRRRSGSILSTGGRGNVGMGLDMEIVGAECARLGRAYARAHATGHRRRRRRHDRRLSGSAIESTGQDLGFIHKQVTVFEFDAWMLPMLGGMAFCLAWLSLARLVGFPLRPTHYVNLPHNPLCILFIDKPSDFRYPRAILF